MVCTRFSSTQNSHWVKSHLGVEWPTEFPQESYPGHVAPLVVKSRQSGRVACGLARFGLIPAWAKDLKIGRHTYNARSETAAQKPSYRHAWRHQQFGLLLVDHFYEPAYDTGQAVPWKIQSTSGDPLGIACLWDRWTDPSTGERVVSFSMLTVNADRHPVMSQFHKPGDEKRTPVIIAPDHHEQWLDADVPQATEMMTWAHMPSLRACASLK
jgi:putative SOS response-associated peptidase YedK